eukprot:s3063_g15.t1
MALVDSESAFKKRCEQLQPGLAAKAEAQNLKTFSTFAFAAGSPQNQVSDVEIGKLAESLYRNPTLGDIATVRRLHFEACTYLLNDMKTNAANSDASEPVKKLPFIEKQTRLEAQKRRITGLLHKPDQQPAHSLIDLAFHIVETGALTYIGPSKCHSRDMEIQAESKQKSKQIITLEQGSLRRVRSAGMTVEQLSGMALGLNAAVVGSLKNAPWTELDQKALEETRAEVEKGWLAESAKVFKGWLQKACELKGQEASLHVPPHLRKILGKKKLLLWKHILVSLGYKDAKIIDEIISGFQLTGWANESGVFDRRVRSAGVTVEQLSGMALGLNAAVVGFLEKCPLDRA